MLGWSAGAPGVGHLGFPVCVPWTLGSSLRECGLWHRVSAWLWGPWPISSLEVEA